ncbi:COP9 signalosome complex subunit 1 isoform X2 [Macrotis lagotis]|uniref:COP9 signalosome complex subunit 1 isoform X2 n=1 Tax=Macrotis lagotis TaxID=92651 RepID=UPI003D689713
MKMSPGCSLSGGRGGAPRSRCSTSCRGRGAPGGCGQVGGGRAGCWAQTPQGACRRGRGSSSSRKATEATDSTKQTLPSPAPARAILQPPRAPGPAIAASPAPRAPGPACRRTRAEAQPAPRRPAVPRRPLGVGPGRGSPLPPGPEEGEKWGGGGGGGGGGAAAETSAPLRASPAAPAAQPALLPVPPRPAPRDPDVLVARPRRPGCGRRRGGAGGRCRCRFRCLICSSRSDLFLPGTAGDFSLSASLSACTLLYEGAVEPMQIDVDPQEDQQNAPDINYVVENPTLDLEQYASSYSGLMRIERLQFIADHCPQLRVEALKMALSFVQRTFNVDVYEEIHRKLSEATRELQNAPDAVPEGGVEPPPLDTAWVEATRKKALLKLEKLDTDLKNYKGNSIKESIRRGHDDLGDHYLDCGDLSNALKCYSRARDYCTSAKHVINMCLNVIKVSVYLQNWSHVLSYVSKAESTPEIAERGERDSQTQAILTKLKCAAGLAELAARKYKQAAKCFLLASFDHCDFPELLSPSNVAVYGGLCALATFDRQELQRNVISSRGQETERSGVCSSFKLFLELEPQVRDIIFKFYESKYASCLKMLDEMKDNLLLDMYLAPHVRTLYTQIRNRALIQYFSPYVSADMRKMAIAFNTTVAALEDELTQLILEGLINARIDSHSKILYARDVDQRSTTFEKSLLMGKEFQRRAKAMILRAAVLRNQIHVKSPPREGSQGELTPANSQSRMSTNM